MRLTICAALLVLVSGVGMALGQPVARPVGRPAAPVGGTITIPYTVPDTTGLNWIIYQQGAFQHSGNQPLYSQSAQLIINGSGFSSANRQARLDPKSNEVVFDEMAVAGVMVSRRILIEKNSSYIRYIDVLRNPGQADVSVNYQVNTNFNYGMQTSQPIADPRSKERTIGYAVMLQAGRSIYEMYGIKGAKTIPQISVPPNNNVVQASMNVSIGAGKQVAIFHVHGTANSMDAGAQTVAGMKDAQLFAQVSPDIRKILVNAPNLQTVGEREVLRGELFDVLELRSGDQIKGTLAEKSYKLQTFYGAVELPADRVVGLINVGQFRPRQLLVTVDGEVFGGTLSKETISMQLSSGQSTQVPLAQINRAGYRKRSGEPEEWTFDKPMISLRSGERMLVAAPSNTIDVMTQYGLLKLQPNTIRALSFQSEEHGVHDIELTDGSRFAGLATADHFELQLVGTASQQNVSFPAAVVSRLQIGKGSEDGPKDDAPILELTNQDQMVGTLAGQLKLDTNFDTITLNGTEMLALVHAPDGGLDVQATLWDQTTLSGQLRDPVIACKLICGVTVNIPVALINKYGNPLPRPSDLMVDRIKAVVAELSAEDWKQRERAEAQLVTMGSSVVPILRELSGTLSLEAQQRIDSVLKQLEKKPAAGSAAPVRILQE